MMTSTASRRAEIDRGHAVIHLEEWYLITLATNKCLELNLMIFTGRTGEDAILFMYGLDT